MRQKPLTVSQLPTEREMSDRAYYYATRLFLTIEEIDEEKEEDVSLSDLHNALLLNLAEVEKRLYQREGLIN